jgi:hypothetical protein
MSISHKNVTQVLAFRKTGTGRVLRPSELLTEYGKPFAGTNFYYGINPTNKATFEDSGNTDALNSTHKAFFDDVLEELTDGVGDEMTVVLGLEPPQLDAPYLFVDANLGLVTRLAEQLDEYQQRAADTSNRLRIVIRYASEMNDAQLSSAPARNKYAGDPKSYKRSFRIVRDIFEHKAPRIEFSFSPAIRRDLNEAGLSQYWPGDDVVDVIGGTWYVGRDADFKGATVFFKAYVLHREMKGKPFGIDEIGGCDADGTNNDGFLQRMFDEIADLQDEVGQFSYATIFLEKKWGADATLTWL